MLINYQGEIKSPSTGEPIADGTYEMLFRVYDVEFGGTPLWVGTHSSLNGNPVEVTGGVFHVVLGSGTGNSMDSSIFNGADRWLEIRIGMETLSPRQRITSVAYSMIAENSRLLDGKESSEFAEAAHTHSGGEITAGTVAESRIDPAIARDSEILPTVLAGDGSGSTLDADLLDGKDSAEFAAAAHNHSGNEITSGSVAEARIDSSIARDSEVDSKITDHAAIADAHHSKTTSFTELTDVAADPQIPSGIARDSEIMPTVLANDGTGSGLDADRIDGAESGTLEESAEIDADIAAHTAIAGAHHTKTTSFSELTDTASDSQIPGSIARDSEVTSAVSSHTAVADAHHTRYTNAEAVAAMGAKADTNPLNHDKTTSFSTLTDVASDSQIPAGVARDAEVNTKISDHTAVASAHHTKTTSFTELTDTASDGQIPAGVARDSEIMPTVLANDGPGSTLNADLLDGQDSAVFVTALSDYGRSGVAANLYEGATTLNDKYVNTSGDNVTGNLTVSGNVGIGTTSPNAKLEVVSSAGQDSVQLNQGEVRTDNVAASTSRYVVSIGGTGYWGLGKTSTGNNNFHIINYPSSRWDLTVRNDTGNVGIGTTSPQEKLDVNGNARVAGDFTVVGTATFGGGTMSKVYLSTSSTIVSTRGGTNVLSWDATNGEIELSNTSGDWCDYWWQAQKGATTSGNSGATATGTSNVAIISGTNSNDYGFELHFGQADGTGGWCSVWLQYANGALVGHYIKY
jgi:hypothetical protein